MFADAMSPEETWQKLSRPIYADWGTNTPARVWVLEHRVFAYRALETRPVEGFPGLIWALVEASCVSRCRGGISVTFWRLGATGWFPHGNACLPHAVKVAA